MLEVPVRHTFLNERPLTEQFLLISLRQNYRGGEIMGFSNEWFAFFNEVHDFQMQHPIKVWFRGQNVDKPLNSSLFRCCFKNLEELKESEKNYYRRFYNLGYSLHNSAFAAPISKINPDIGG